MKKIYRILFLGILITCKSYADTLPLSDQQIAVLRAAQPDMNDNAPLTWKGDPISIALPIGQEKRIMFPEPIEVDFNGKLTTDQLHIINNNQSVYLTAQKIFSQTRVYVTLKQSRQMILLDIATVDGANAAAQKIVLPKPMNTSTQTSAKTQQNIPDTGKNEKIISADSYVNAMRFAWQQLYAPQRLLNTDRGFVRTPLRSPFWTPDLIYGDKVLVHPTASWQFDGLYVTVVELRNKYPHPVSIHLARELCGDWQAASVYPRVQLKPAGDKSGDATTLFLISSKPFSIALEVCHDGA